VPTRLPGPHANLRCVAAAPRGRCVPAQTTVEHQAMTRTLVSQALATLVRVARVG